MFVDSKPQPDRLSAWRVPHVAMGDFVTNSQTSLATLYDHCDLLKNVLHDVLRLEVGDKLDHVRCRYAVCDVETCYSDPR